MKANSMRAVNTDMKQMMMKTSSAVAYPTCTVQYSAVQYSTVKCSALQYSVVQYSTVRAVSHLRLCLAAEPDGDDCKHGGGAQLGAGGGLLALVRLDQPEGDPGAHHDDVQGHVHLQGAAGVGDFAHQHTTCRM